MEFSDFVQQAIQTNRTKEDEALQVGLYGIAGEAGSVVSEAKKWFREGSLSPGLGENISEELGDLLWYIALVSSILELDLNQVATANLAKTRALWSDDLPALPQYDQHPHDVQKLPRHFIVIFEEHRENDLAIVRMMIEGISCKQIREQNIDINQLGDDLDDNSIVDDGYRYHDIIHLGHATVLGWSPVLRALIGAKRKNVGHCDRTEDGARAVAIEEGLAAFVFNYLRPFDFTSDRLDWNLFNHIRRTVGDLEVRNQPIAAWRHAYRQAFKIFLELHKNRGGTVECDLDNRKLTLIN